VNSPHGDLVTLVTYSRGATPGFVRLVGTVQNNGRRQMTYAGGLGDGSPPVGTRGNPPEADVVFLILQAIFVPKCDAYCLLQTIKFMQTYKYNFHITVTILSVDI